VLPLSEFSEPPAVGTSFDFKLVDFREDLWTLSRAEARRVETYRSLHTGAWTKGVVRGHNQGGFEVEVGPIRGFLPFSQTDGKSSEPDDLIGESLVLEVLEVVPGKDRLVLSRRKVVEEERRKKREASLETLTAGSLLTGAVERVESYGAFVNLTEGVTGLLHVSEWDHQRIEDLTQHVAVGDRVEVKVLSIEEGGRRISLSRKQLQAHPWDGLCNRLVPEQLVLATVTRVAEYGAFLELEPGIEGLLHVSQLSPDRVRRVADHVQRGDQVQVRILSMDEDSRRISLSRLTTSGILLGSEEDVSETDLSAGEQALQDPASGSQAGTNLGALLRAALDGKSSDKKPRRR
jgi:ribosomal protein S1